MNTHNQSCIPVELRIALYRRAVACAYQTTVSALKSASFFQ
ncbi:hypothetical protein SJI19_23285 [Acerihabitans sp. TG2]|nr:hypothetical protein [Acerihabitans sp. TG2]MEA9393418.1 hypothetical protein [Acerihabitans sp. TG2]